ncbi:S-layer homology domain-containing protein [Alteribacillus sp. YIM 98480]|uniref:S-layer homology domain-containing protein n=1 Tax=Alteribacillus sp. YIM 98480 TaxID=2606599 RepID=UPI00131D4150|nr:S-layer homology domain-containing protein [Alteribacillus sp. YIM 98480]
MKYKYVGLCSLSTVLAVGLSTPAFAAQVQQMEEESVEEVEIQEADVDVKKEDLIERLHSLFPGQFDFLEEQDFQMNNHHMIGWEDETIRHSLLFNKREGDQHISGSVEFVGDDLELHNFHYQPKDIKGALYPPEVTQEEAKQIAEDFVNKTTDGEYELSDQVEPHVTWGNRTLTEPVEFQFYFQRLENGVPVVNQNLNVTILGNGEMTRYNRSQPHSEPAEYEKQDDIIEKENVVADIKNNLDIELQYMLHHEPGSTEPEVRLVYAPSPSFGGVHAINGKWEVGQSFEDDFPKETELKKLSNEENTVDNGAVSREDVEALAEELLSVKEEDGELHIDSIREANRNDREVFTVQYSIRQGNSGYGSSFDVNKETGEIMNYHNPTIQNQQPEDNLSYEEALEKALEALEQYVPSIMHEYAYPINDMNKKADQGIYRFHFPQVKNDILVNGSSLNVSISAEDGSLESLYRNSTSIANWPSAENTVDKETALEDYVNNLEVDLSYINHPQAEENNKYYLVYRPAFKDGFEYYDALTGKWSKREQEEKPSEPVFSDHWAADELNYMIESDIISADEETDPNHVIKKGDALEVIMKSLTRFHEVPPAPQDQEPQATFENIDPDHELFQVIERAAERNIIDTDSSTFAIDEPLTRQTLAYWYVRALGLEAAAKHSDIYQVPFSDADAIPEKYKGYVALSHELGLFQGNAENEFNPENEVTLAQLAVSNFRLAETANDLDVAIN